MLLAVLPENGNPTHVEVSKNSRTSGGKPREGDRGLSGISRLSEENRNRNLPELGYCSLNMAKEMMITTLTATNPM